MKTAPTHPKDRLIFALDVPDRKEAERLVKNLADDVGMFKVGLELFLREGPDVLKTVRDHTEAGIFLDLKLHDIPATVARAVRSAVQHGVQFLTVHCSGGEAMLMEAVAATQGSSLQILGVTVLTSMSPDDLIPALGYFDDITPSELVVARASLAEQCGCHGVVCSGQELESIKKKCRQNLQTVVPGIRPSWNIVKKDDQSRIITPGDAIKNGADYLVVGRPIRDADDPKIAARKIVGEIDRALNAT